MQPASGNKAISSGSDNEWSVEYAGGVTTLKCRLCGGTFTTADRRRRYCSTTCSEQASQTSLRARVAKHRDAYPTREVCRQAFKNAILLGKVRRCTRCERCGSRGRIEAHHADYSKPFFVEWLCKGCHEAAA